MRSKIILLLTVGFCITGCHTGKKTANERNQLSYPDANKEMAKTWNHFLSVIDENDKPGFKDMACEKIRCYWCLENTPAEQKALEKLMKTDSSSYDTIYKDKIFIPAKKFIRDDFDIIFTDAFVSKLKTRETKFGKRNDNVYEVLVTTTLPTAFHEGGQHNFQFRKKGEQFKLCEIGTIP